MISKIFAQVLEEIKIIGGVLSPEQEIALEEIHEKEMVVANAQTRLYDYSKIKR